jgi:formylglycine-generating enzyme required for sulfatase activity
MPRTGVSRADAAKLCAERGERLCTEKEWERACRGPGGTSYPYGTTYQAGRCNTQGGPVRAAGSFMDCKSGSGAFDMSGNVAEWTESGMIKGGAAGEGDPAGRCSHHVKSHGEGAESVGFRCCATPR